jgi:hypothetical protein
MQSGRIFYGRLRLEKGCFAGGDDDDENHINILYCGPNRPTAEEHCGTACLYTYAIRFDTAVMRTELFA